MQFTKPDRRAIESRSNRTPNDTDWPNMTAPLPWLADALAELDRSGLRRRRRAVTPQPHGRCRIDGRTLVNFSTNDYLDLAADRRPAEAARKALQECGSGARASALVSGRTEWHARLERRIAAFEREQSAVLFPTGYAANLGTLAALIGPGDAVFCDRFNHASLIDGVRLAGAKLRVYRHDRLDRLQRELKKTGPLVSRRWIVTDAVFSMDGDLAPLRALCDLADEYNAAVIVDEAHATGVFGESGRGVCEELGTEDRVAVRVGTLSKALGSLGGFVVGDRELTDWLWNTARPQVFSTALPPAACAAAAAALDVVEKSPWRRRRLQLLAARLRNRLADCGLLDCGLGIGDCGLEKTAEVGGQRSEVGEEGSESIGDDDETQHPSPLTTPPLTAHQPASHNPQSAIPNPQLRCPIVPVVIGDPEPAVEIARRLQERGFFVPAIRPPTVPRGTSRLRISLCCGHTEADVDGLAAVLAELVPTRRNR